MALIHTIQIANEKNQNSTVSSTRKSETRKYLACLVATTTEATVQLLAQKRAKIEAELVMWKASLKVALELHNMTVEEAKAHHEVICEPWYKAKFATNERIRTEVTGKSWGHVANLDARVEAELVAQGLENPYTGSWAICSAASQVEARERQLARWSSPPVGSQAVLSWHGSVSLADKALSSREASWAREQGDTVMIRTDITITETKKRAPKVASV